MRRLKKTCITIGIAACSVTGFMLLNWMAVVTMRCVNGDYSSNDYKVVKSFYNENKDSLDGVFIGSSAVYRFWNAPMAYKDYGMCVYGIATSNQPISIEKSLLMEAAERQDSLKFAVIEIRNISKYSVYFDETNAKAVSDAMPLMSANRIEAIDSYIEYCEALDADVDKTPGDYYLPMFREKGSWLKAFNMDRVKHSYNYDNGVFKGYRACFDVVAQEDVQNDLHLEELLECKQNLFDDLLKAANECEFDVIFVAAPITDSPHRVGLVNSACRYLQNRGATVLNFNDKELRDELELDFDTDFYDGRHVNDGGAEQYTKYMSKYLADRYDLPDHRRQKGYESWEEALEKYKDFIQDKEGKS